MLASVALRGKRSGASGLAQKLYNWSTLNAKVRDVAAPRLFCMRQII